MSSQHPVTPFLGRATRFSAGFLHFLRLHPWTALVVFCVVPALVLRGHLLGVYLPESLSPSWLFAVVRGVVSDAAFALTLSLALYRPFSGKASGPLLVGVFLSLLYAGNHEHVYYNYAHVNVAMASMGLSGEVLLGNFLIAPVFAAAALAFTVSLAAALGISVVAQRMGGKRPRQTRALRGLAGSRARRDKRDSHRSKHRKDAATSRTSGHGRRTWTWLLPSVLVVLSAALPVDIEHPGFVQTSIPEANVRRLVSVLRSPASPEVGPPTAGDVASGWERFHPRDLSGLPAISFPSVSRESGHPPNILMVLLEGWDRHVMAAGYTPELEALADANVFLPNVIAHQVQTHRGLYSILCGDYPNLLLADAKPDVVGEFGTSQPCLPGILAGYGYETVFMQSADLHFMRKDRFGAAIGFGEVHGSALFADAPRSSWGVDDGTLMQGAVARISRLDKGGGPWMVALLTSGTHPPYFVSDDYVDHPEAGARERAFRYADRVTSELIEDLRLEGLLRDTWVCVLSDEASTKFNRDMTGDYVSYLSGGFHLTNMLVIAPERQDARLEGFFGLKDIMISVLDLLGLDESVPGARGRSLFREYGDAAPIIYSSLYEDVFLVRENTTVNLCRRNLDGCLSVRRDDHKGDVVQHSDAELVADAHEFARASDFGYEDLGRVVTVFEERATLYKERHRRVIGNRQVGVRVGQRLVWRVLLAAPANNREESRAVLWTSLPGDKSFTKEWTIAPGASVSFVEGRTFDRDGVVTTELFVYPGNDDSIFVREVSLRKSAPGA